VYEDKQDNSAELSIVIRDVAKYLSVGQFTRCIRKRPPLKGDDDLLIAIPKNVNKNEKEILWIDCSDLKELKYFFEITIEILFYFL
jgi:hypothetical protein